LQPRVASQNHIRKAESIEEATQERIDKPVSKDGWIWNIGTIGKMTDEEVRAWSEEADRVQWFRTEAEMTRWQEEFETWQADLMRCICTFEHMSSVWKKLSE
jgi:hypothetical protein